MKHGNGFKEVQLSSAAASGLCNLNEKKRGEKSDCHFLMALLIGTCTMKKFKENEAVEEGILELIKDLFAWRVMNDKKRMMGFANLVTFAINAIKTNNFKVNSI